MRTRADRLQDKRDDLEYHLDEFSRLLKPSERRAWERRLEKLDSKLAKLRGDNA